MHPSTNTSDSVVNGGVEAASSNPRRKMSMDLTRIRNFPSTLSLRKQEESTTSASASSTTTTPGAFTRIRNFKQAQVRREGSTKDFSTSEISRALPSSSNVGSASVQGVQTSPGPSLFRRGSRILDAFRPAKKPMPTFEVVRKRSNRSAAHPPSHPVHNSPTADAERQNRRMSGVSFELPRNDDSRSSMSALRNTSTDASGNASTNRSPYPPSTSATRKLSSTAQAALTTSDSIAQPQPDFIPTQDASPGRPRPDTKRHSFSLHSFRNIRSNTDGHEDGSHSRRQSMISADEFATPREELSEPNYHTESLPLGTQQLDPTLRTPGDDATAASSRSVSPALNAANSSVKTPSMSAAKFRQAARQRSESGNIPTQNSIQSGSAQSRPIRSRTPSQELAMVESVLSSSRTNPPAPVVEESAALTNQILPHSHPSSMKQRGLFIVVEGLDRAGKSTQVERLTAHLNARSIKFPERTTAIGVMINSYLAQTSDLDDQAIHLLFSANRWESVASIRAAIQNGETIVCDRYAFSGIAYSVAKGLSYEWCRNPDVGLPLPDLTMFLDLDADTAAARGGYGEERYEKLEFQAKVRDAFRRVSQDVVSHGGRWVTIDASKTLEQVTAEIQDTVLRAASTIDRPANSLLGRLFVSQKSRNRNSFLNNGNASSLTNGAIPASIPSVSPLSFGEQVAANRAAAPSTLSGYFNKPTSATDAGTALQQQSTDGVSPHQRGQGIDSARVLANHQDADKRRTLIDIIAERESGQEAADRKALHRRSMSAAVEERPSSRASGVLASALSLVGRSRRSSEQVRPVSDMKSDTPERSMISATGDPSRGTLSTSSMSDRRKSIDGSRLNGQTSEHAVRGRPSLSNLSTRPSLSSQNTTNSAVSSTPRVSFSLARGHNESPHEGANGGHFTHSGHSEASLSTQQMGMKSVQQSQAEMQEQYMRNYMAMMANPMLAQQAHYQMMMQRQQQQYYARAVNGSNGAQTDANGVFASNGSSNGAVPTAAFMQQQGPPDAGYQAAFQEQLRRERQNSRHRTLSSGSLAEPSSPLHPPQQQQQQQQQPKQPMLSMMMAAPPPAASTAPNSPSLQAQHAFYHPQQQQMLYGGNGFASTMAYPMQQYSGPNLYGQRPFYRNTAHSETVLPTIYGGPANGGVTPATTSRKSSVTNLRSQRSVDRGLRKPES